MIFNVVLLLMLSKLCVMLMIKFDSVCCLVLFRFFCRNVLLSRWISWMCSVVVFCLSGSRVLMNFFWNVGIMVFYVLSCLCCVLICLMSVLNVCWVFDRLVVLWLGVMVIVVL